MNISFETIGNATLICHDSTPILTTDPWISGSAYFGSWSLSHEIPEDQLDAIRACRYVWLSHGHPDHLNADSMRFLRDKRILLSDHVGGRIARGLKEQGYNVSILEDYRWHTLSDHIRILTISDYNQDSILLIDINGRLLVNLNDAFDHGWGPFVKRVISKYAKSFLLSLSGFGDSDMINFFDESGNRILPAAAMRLPVGKQLSDMARIWGTRAVIPFSSMHRYQRADSMWADTYTTRLPDYPVGFDTACAELLPAFIRYDCQTDTWEELRPAEKVVVPHDPREYGDDWTECLEPSDVPRVRSYFLAIEHLSRCFDLINVRVGGQDNIIELSNRRFDRAITFEVPRASLMTAINYQIFDDLLIGNFMKTTLHGNHPPTGLYPDFEPYVAKYADNGFARSPKQLAAYFAAYRRRAPIDYFRFHLERRSIDAFRSFVPEESTPYRLARRAYRLATYPNRRLSSTANAR